MSNRHPTRDTRQLAREKALFRYTSALERGDFDTVAAVLRAAETDAELERMILEVNAELVAESAPRIYSNGRHSHAQMSFGTVEEHGMTTLPVSTAREGSQRQPRIQDRRLPLIAAVLAVILFGAIALFASRLGPNEPPNSFAALQPQNSATPTLQPSRTATRQASATFAASRLPSRTPVPTESLTPTPIAMPVMTATLMSQIGMPSANLNGGIIASADTVNLRGGPGLEYAVIATLMPGTNLSITALTNEEWTQVQLEDGSIGWVASVNIVYNTQMLPTVPPPATTGWLGAPSIDLLDYVCQIAGASGPTNGIAVYDAPLNEANLIGYLPPSGYYSIFTQVGDWWEVFVLPAGTPANGERPGRLGWVPSANLQTTGAENCQSIPLPTPTLVAMGAPSQLPPTERPYMMPNGEVTATATAIDPFAITSRSGEQPTPVEGDVIFITATIVPTALPPTLIPASAPATTSGFEYGGQVLNDIRSQRSIDAMHQAEMTWMKVAFNHTTGLSPQVAYSAIQAAHVNGFRILLTITGDAQSAASRTYQREYANFLGEVAVFGPDAIEVWNEPNIDRSWTRGEISGAAYTGLLIDSYEAIKEANPDVLVISAAPAPTGAGDAFPEQIMNDDQFLREMVEAGALDYLDCVGMHYNEGILSPTESEGDSRDDYYTRYFNGMVNVYTEIVGDVPLCFTELGYLSGEGYSPLPPAFAWAANTGQDQQAAWLSEAVSLAAQGGRVRLLIVYNVDAIEYDANPQAGYSILRPDGNCYACLSLAAAL